MEFEDQLVPQATVVHAPRRTKGDLPEPLNQRVWDDLYAARGCKTSRDKRRLDFSLAREFSRLKADDKFIVALLEQLASCVPQSPVTTRVLELTRSILAYPLVKGALAPECDALLSDLLTIKVDPAKYRDPESYFWDNQVVKLLSKYPFRGFDSVGELAALKSFLDCEQQNAVTNRAWSTLAPTPLIERISERMHELMGTCPSTQEVIDNGSWGPGTVVGFSFDRTRTGPEFKFASQLTLTPTIIPIATQVVESIPAWDSAISEFLDRHNRFVVCSGNSFFTVPKKFKMDRGACKEPALNVFLQLGTGIVLRRNLLAADGVNLRRSSVYNQEYAKLGSVSGLFCTVDLSNASNNLCRAPIRSVVSSDWWSLLDALASPVGLLPSDLCSQLGLPSNKHRYQMLGTMGNGFTFELETILFRAIVTSIVPGVWTTVHGRRKLAWPHVHVFGDDLVFPTAYHGQVSKALSLFGFTVNEEKSFSSGPFRESCGKDYFEGVSVRPLYITKRLDNGDSIVTLANKVISFAMEGDPAADFVSSGGPRPWHRVWAQLCRKVPRFVRDLIVTPPSVPNGLWGAFGRTTWCTSTGVPPRYRVIQATPVRVNLSAERSSPVMDGDSILYNGISLDRGNLLASRLDQLTSQKEESNRWQDLACMQSSGQDATLRDVVTYKVGIEHISESHRWSWV